MFKTHFERGLTQKLAVFLLLMIGFVPIYAQKNITGKVIDEKGEPLIGCHYFGSGFYYWGYNGF